LRGDVTGCVQDGGPATVATEMALLITSAQTSIRMTVTYY